VNFDSFISLLTSVVQDVLVLCLNSSVFQRWLVRLRGFLISFSSNKTPSVTVAISPEFAPVKFCKSGPRLSANRHLSSYDITAVTYRVTMTFTVDRCCVRNWQWRHCTRLSSKLTALTQHTMLISTAGKSTYVSPVDQLPIRDVKPVWRWSGTLPMSSRPRLVYLITDIGP
jgi:hypothetical protein